MIVIDNAGDVFFDPLPVFFLNKGKPVLSDEDEMRVEIMVFDLHEQQLNKRIRLVNGKKYLLLR